MSVIFLYPEIHFRFGGVSPSKLFSKEPEIIFDTPKRVKKSATHIPLFLLINHINLYPIDILLLKVEISGENFFKTHLFSSIESCQISHPLNNRARFYSIKIPLDDLPFGKIKISPTLLYRCNDKEKRCGCDNLNTTSKRAFTLFRSKEELPIFSADLHCHSHYSQSHVEFGPPLQAFQEAADSSGIGAVAVIDHSYDLECCPENYLKKTKTHPLWSMQKRELDLLNPKPLIVASEELSLRKRGGGVVHLGVIGNRDLIIGSGDGARGGYRRNLEPELCKDFLNNLKRDGVLFFAAHPGEKTTLAQRLFLRRDNWRMRDFDLPINTLQILNRGVDASWYRARRMWIQTLLKGKRIAIIAGNDAHGDFNRYRATGLPFLSIKEDFHRHFGLAKTGFYREIETEKDLISEIECGRTFVTTGPSINITDGHRSLIGREYSAGEKLFCELASSEEFGFPRKLTLFWGSKKREMAKTFCFSKEELSISIAIDSDIIAESNYIRAELWCSPSWNGTETFAATGPTYRDNL